MSVPHPRRRAAPVRALLALAAAVLTATSLAGCSGSQPRRPEKDKPATQSPTPKVVSTRNATGPFTNPVHTQDSPDPHAIQVGDKWYLVHTNSGGRNVPLLTSPDLVRWTEAGDAMPKLPEWADPGNTWAPELLALADNRYVLYFTASAREQAAQCIGRAVASSPRGPFKDDSGKPMICQKDEGGSIDASPFRDTDGSLHLLWKNDGNAVSRDTWLWSQPLSPDGLSLTGEPVKLLKQTEQWEGKVVEAPLFTRQGDTLFLFYAANAYDRSVYAEGYATCASTRGPCTKAPENPVLRSSDAASGPGHGCLVVKDGKTWLLYHAWEPGTEGTSTPGRQLWLDQVTWEGGRPRVHGPTATPQQRP